MTEKEFRKLKALDLIQILLKQSGEVAEQQSDLDRKNAQLELLLGENDIIKAKLNDRDAMTEEIKKKLDESDERIRKLEIEVKNLYSDRQITLKETGSLVQAALELNQIFELAQREAEQYIYNVERRIGARHFEALGVMEEFEELRKLEKVITRPQAAQTVIVEEPVREPVNVRKAEKAAAIEPYNDLAVMEGMVKASAIDPYVERYEESVIMEDPAIDPAADLYTDPAIMEDPAIDPVAGASPPGSLPEEQEDRSADDDGLLKPDEFKKLLEQEEPPGDSFAFDSPKLPWMLEPEPKAQTQPPELPQQALKEPPEKKPEAPRKKGLFSFFRRKK